MGLKVTECINIYEKLMEFKYAYTLEDGTVISFQFMDAQFHHLIGLHKLTDIPQLQKEKGRRSTSLIYKNLKDTPKNVIDYERIISNSAFYSLIKDRVAYFNLIPDLLSNCKVVVDFDYRKIVDFETELKGTDYILYKRLSDGKILHLTLRIAENNMIVPETFFMYDGKVYLENQDLLEVVSFQKIEKGKRRK